MNSMKKRFVRDLQSIHQSTRPSPVAVFTVKTRKLARTGREVSCNFMKPDLFLELPKMVRYALLAKPMGSITQNATFISAFLGGTSFGHLPTWFGSTIATGRLHRIPTLAVGNLAVTVPHGISQWVLKQSKSSRNGSCRKAMGLRGLNCHGPPRSCIFRQNWKHTGRNFEWAVACMLRFSSCHSLILPY